MSEGQDTPDAGDDRRDQDPGRGARQAGEGSQTSERLMGIVEKLVDQLDVAAAFIVDSIAGDLLGPLVQARRALWIGAALFLMLGVFGLAAPVRFMEALPYILGGLFILVSLGLLFLDRLAGKIEGRVRELLAKAETWKKLSGWARRFI